MSNTLHFTGGYTIISANPEITGTYDDSIREKLVFWERHGTRKHKFPKKIGIGTIDSSELEGIALGLRILPISQAERATFDAGESTEAQSAETLTSPNGS